jgi:beta-lactamase class A
MVDQGRASLTSEYPLLMPLRSARFSSPAAPVREGEYMTAAELIDIMITRSSNPATDAMLAAVGGVSAVNDWARRAGISNFNLTRDIATLVRDDGEFDPAVHVDLRDSSTPRAMVELLAGIYQGRWLSPASRSLMISTMERTRTGARRIRGLMPGDVTVAHKTGSLNNTSSDIGIITAPDGRSIAVAIYVTGQGTRANREARIASIARAIYDGYTARANDGRVYASADYPVAGS